MNLKGPVVSQSNIFPEFYPQTVGSKGVQLNSLQKKIRLLPEFFSRDTSACEVLREIVLGNKH